MMKKVLFLMFGITLVIALSCNQTKNELKLVKFQGEAQGTYYAVTYYDFEARNFQSSIDSILTQFDRCASIYIDSSIISRVNNNDSNVLLDSNFIQIFQLSQKVSEQTDGAFDCTVGPLVNAWGFGFKQNKTLEVAKVDTLMKYIGYKKVHIENQQLVKEFPQILLDFNAIAQGFSVDVIARFLESKGVQNYLIDVGGEVLGKGKKIDGALWVVGIEKPAPDSEAERVVQTKVQLKNSALCTSGNYRKYRIINGKKYAHEIDPKTGFPVSHNLLSVSVMASDCGAADAYATAFMVMGLQKSKTFLEKHPELQAYFIFVNEKGELQTDQTPKFQQFIKP